MRSRSLPWLHAALQLVLILALLLAAALCACTADQAPAAGAGRAPRFTLRVDGASYLGAAAQGSFSLKTTAGGEQVVVEVAGHNLRGLKALYFTLDYDPAQLRPVAAEAGALQGQGQLLSLALLNTPGAAQYGQIVIHPGECGGLDGEQRLATLRFARQACGGNLGAKQASKPPTDNASASALVDDGSGKLTWLYYNRGDYDQNGLVNLSDMTPLAAHFGALGPFAATTALSVIDGDGNGLINLADITPIAQGFGNDATGGYGIYTATLPNDYPKANNAKSTIARLAKLTLAEATGTPSLLRRAFAYQVSAPVSGAFYWVRPLDSKYAPGTPSNLAGGVARIERSLDSADQTGYSCSLKLIGERPAAAYQNALTHELFFVRAKDEGGAAWNDPVKVASGVAGQISLAEVAGNPTIAYIGYSGLICVRASDSAGAAWSTPAVVNDSAQLGDYCSLENVNGRAGIAYQGNLERALFFSRALYAEAQDWAEPLQLDQTMLSSKTCGSKCSLAIIDGNPGVSYARETSLYFVRSTDWNGIAWAAPTFIVNTTYDESSSLADVRGRAAIAFMKDSSLRYVRATDPAGTVWPHDITLDDVHILGSYLSLAVVGGKPAVAYADFNPRLLLIRASDDAGSAWDAPFLVKPGENSGWDASLADVHGYPAMAYRPINNVCPLYTLLVQ